MCAHGYVVSMSDGDGDRVQVVGASEGHPPPRTPGGVLLILAGLVVGLAVGVLLASSGTPSNGANEPPVTTTTTVASATSSTTTSVATSARIEQYLARIEVLESELVQARQLVAELGLETDPVKYAFVVDCDARQQADGFEANTYLVGPVGFWYAYQDLSGDDIFIEVFASVEPGDSVTLVVPASERDHYSLLWNPATWTGENTVGAGEPAVTLQACDGYPTVFAGGFVTEQSYCAPLDVYFGDSTERERVFLPFGSVNCPEGTTPPINPEPGPVPDVTGLTLREARLAIRLAALVPSVNTRDHIDPEGMVWAQEPGDGGTYQPGMVIGLRTCQPADHVVATYQGRLDSDLPRTEVTLSNGWMAPSLNPSLESWYFVSALVSGGPADGQIATWVLPPWVAPDDPANTPSISFPVNDASRSLNFGDSRFNAENYGADDPLDLDGAIATQRCVALSQAG